MGTVTLKFKIDLEIIDFLIVKDGISRVTFGPNSSQFLLVSSWDKKVEFRHLIFDN